VGAGERGEGGGEVVHCGCRRGEVSVATRATVHSPGVVVVVVVSVVRTVSRKRHRVNGGGELRRYVQSRVDDFVWRTNGYQVKE